MARTSADLAPYLTGKGEEPGYSLAGAVTTESSGRDWAQLAGVNPKQTQAQVQQLQSDGFKAGAIQQLQATGTPGQGISSVALFTSSSGAGQAASQALAQLTKITQKLSPVPFATTAIPNSSGITATDFAGSTSELLWQEGDCLFSITNSGASTLAASELSAAQSIYQRTSGTCS
jgi:transcription initiation factor TFIID subunit TAF12